MCVTLPDGNKHVVTGSLDDTARVKVATSSGSSCTLLYTGSSCFAYLCFGTFNSWKKTLVLEERGRDFRFATSNLLQDLGRLF